MIVIMKPILGSYHNMVNNKIVPAGGTHLILDLEGIEADLLSDAEFLELIMRDAAKVSNATVLFGHFHHFGIGYGVTGIIGLAESHMSIHTWPEEGYASMDIYMCGDCNPMPARDHIIKRLGCTMYYGSTLYRRKLPG